MEKVKIKEGNDKLKGTVITESLPSGMTFHMVDAKAECDFSFEEELSPNFKIAILFSSTMDMRFGENKTKLMSKSHHAKLMNFSEPELCSMKVNKGQQRSALYLSVPPDWFEKHELDSKPIIKEINKHFSLEDWALPDMFWQQAEHLLKYNQTDFNCSMARQGFAMSLMSCWIEATNQGQSSKIRVSDRRSRQFEEFLRSDDVLYMSLDGISEHLAMSAATLQRYSRDILKMSLSQFLRNRRLEASRKALRYDGVSIQEAALIAGYNHASNFTSAFKQNFGLLPTELKG
ncbi:helix-turn-helix transcriptional regulator [Marinomonas epiphytica]